MTNTSPVAAVSRSRGRKATFDRDQALDIALDLFWRHGYEGVSIADLCQAIRIAPPSLYHAFGSKADLYREALRRYGASNLTPDDVAAKSSAFEAVNAVLEHGIRTVTRSGGPVGCPVSSGMLMPGPDYTHLAAELRILRAELRHALEARISRDVEAKVLPSTTEPMALARFYATVLQGLSVQAIDGATRDELEAVVVTALHAWPTYPTRVGTTT